MIIELNINDRAALAIKNNTKRVEIRAYKKDYSKLKKNDIIEFNSDKLGIFYVKVKEVNYYKTLDELFTMEGTRYTTSSTNDNISILLSRLEDLYISYKCNAFKADDK